MARNRQRAKERKQRTTDSGLPLPDDGSPELVDAAIAGGAPPSDLGTHAPPVDFDDDDDDAVPAGDGRSALDAEELGAGAGDVATPRKPSGFRLINFFRACWAELQRVQWPDRRQVGQATAVVLGFVVIAGAFLGLADVVAQRIVNLIL